MCFLNTLHELYRDSQQCVLKKKWTSHNYSIAFLYNLRVGRTLEVI